MAMITINDYSLQPAHITYVGPYMADAGDELGSVRFYLSGGHIAHFSGTRSACEAKRAEVVAAVNALDTPVEP